MTPISLPHAEDRNKLFIPFLNVSQYPFSICGFVYDGYGMPVKGNILALEYYINADGEWIVIWDKAYDIPGKLDKNGYFNIPLRNIELHVLAWQSGNEKDMPIVFTNEFYPDDLCHSYRYADPNIGIIGYKMVIK